MKYYVKQDGNVFKIFQEGIHQFSVGHIYPVRVGSGGVNYRVGNDWSGQIAVVKSVDEGVTKLAEYYKENPPWWDDWGWHPGECHVKETTAGTLWVAQIRPGQWLAYINHDEVLIKGERATFATCEEAQRAASASLRQLN